jgi:hypothetical protein
MTLFAVIIVSTFVAFMWTGWEMVQYHSNCSPIDRPAYVRHGFGMKLLVSLTWPYVAVRGKELAWFSATFAGSAVWVGTAIYLLHPMNVPC